jgi:Zn-dependent peptidase ImmA (M78 family)
MRNAKSSEGSDFREIEANQFAACLLMPEHLVHEKVKALKSHDVEDAVKRLARTFRVSEKAMAIRLGVLGYEAT